MPLYDFKCEVCDALFERIVSYSEIDNQYCDSCVTKDGLKQKLIKLESFTSFKPILKGTGYYETDYKTKKQREST